MIDFVIWHSVFCTALHPSSVNVFASYLLHYPRMRAYSFVHRLVERFLYCPSVVHRSDHIDTSLLCATELPLLASRTVVTNSSVDAHSISTSLASYVLLLSVALMYRSSIELAISPHYTNLSLLSHLSLVLPVPLLRYIYCDFWN